MDSKATRADLDARNTGVPEFDDDDGFIDLDDEGHHPASRSAWAIAVLGGALATVNGPAPTGQPVVDVVLTGTAVAAVIWFCSVVPIRFAAFVSLAAGCASLTWPGLVLGVVSYVTAASNSLNRQPPRWVSSALVALAMNLAARSELGWFLGASAVVGCGLAVVTVIRAFPRHPSRVRRRIAAAIVVYLLVTAVGVGALVKAGVDSRSDLSSGERIVRRGLDELVSGDVETAVESFEDAEAAFDRANNRLSGPLPRLSAVVPVASQHRRAGVELTSEARAAARTLVRELAPIDLETLTFRAGRIDVDAIAALSGPLTAVRADISDLRTTVADIDDPWLVGPVRDRLDDLQDDVAEQLDRSQLFVDVVDRVPDMLGRDGPRRYFVAFTTPSEVRGLGGFMGNYAEVTIDDGAIDLTRFGRTNELDAAARPGDRTVTGPADWLARYGRFGFDNGPGGGVNIEAWKNITMSASMESTGRVIAELYPQSGGSEVDGVFALDVFAVGALLEITGPIELPDDEGFVTAESAPRFFLKEQYDDLGEQFDIGENDDRIDVLETVSTSVFETLLETELPPPIEILDLMGPLVERGSIAAYADDAAEQGLLERSGLAGTLVDPQGGDGLAVTYNNAAGSKIDFFLRSTADYNVVADATTGSVESVLELTMENRSPASGQPSYVIGNAIGAPLGTNQTFVSVYSRLPLTRATLDGTQIVTEQANEAGYYVTGALVRLGAGEIGDLRFEFAGSLDLTDGYSVTVRTPPLADPIAMRIDATLDTAAGVAVENVDYTRPGRRVVDVVAPPADDG